MKKKLLIITAILELPAGLCLLFAPTFSVSMLFGAQQDLQLVKVLACTAGAAIISLAIICWLARNNRNSGTVIAGILFYNIAVAGILLHSAVIIKMSGALLWPAAGLHFILAGWCIYCLQANTAKVLRTNF